MRWMILFLLTLVIFTACQKDLDNEVELISHELFEDDNVVAKIHIDKNSSEYIQVNYDGIQRFDIVYQVWLDGELLDVEDKILDFELSKNKGFSFELFESEGKINVLMGLYTESGENRLTFPIEQIEDCKVEKIIESTHDDDYKSNDDAEIFLWGVHKLKEGSGINEMTENVYDVAENSTWSIIFLLVPVEK